MMGWQPFVQGVVAAGGIFANGLILFSCFRYKTLRKITYSFLVSLAICDFLKSLVIANVVVYLSIDSYRKGICMETGILGFTLMCCTTFHLATESVNRYLHVVWPFEYAREVKKLYLAIVIALLWILPVVFGVITPLAWFGEDWLSMMHFHDKIFGCERQYDKEKTDKDRDGYVILMYVTFFAVPLLVMIIAYGLVLKTSYSIAKDMREKEVRRSTTIKSPTVMKTAFSNPVIEMVSATYSASVMSEDLAIKGRIKHKSERSMSIAQAQREIKRRIKQRKREIKSSKTVLIMISAFVICNAPIFTLVWFTDAYDARTAETLLQLFLTLSQIQVIVNPLVYFLRLKDFKEARRKCKHVSNTIIRKTIRRI